MVNIETLPERKHLFRVTDDRQANWFLVSQTGETGEGYFGALLVTTVAVIEIEAECVRVMANNSEGCATSS